ncbi:YdeI/OmpD-associated family protein [Croceitalea sp. MTPC9]|uniref:YdeI/OmpD-associated family protein n=1 Tax=unclassified Croceitalea TaxID=2632280 RepID=UPI002B36B159|nr:YdeI/OmpD-associated family protein [Croceitalea sp. MTPC6]GMN15362.1 YdeI/OmpD-associated family protein [Croceitalea sp. MTPC9]
MKNIEELYFKDDTAWRAWLHENYSISDGIYLIFYKVVHEMPSMRWEEAVRVALCYGWIDSTVKSLGNGKRRQYFCPRKPKSVWSKVNKDHLKELEAAGLIHESGYLAIEIAKENGSWTVLDDVENGIIPNDLQRAFNKNPRAFKNYQGFTRGQQKSYLYWLNQAKREETRQKRITEIISLCKKGVKSRNTR